jgi:hypothetical protein
MRHRFHRAHLLAFVTGLVNQDLLLRNKYLIAENRILRGHLPMRLRLADPERVTLAEIAKRLGRKALKDVAQVAKPDTILAWYRRLIAQKFDGSRHRGYRGASAGLFGNRGVVRMARENRPGAMIASWARPPSWAIGSQTKLWATFCVDTRSHQRRSGVARPPGRSSSGRTWTCSLAQTSSRSKC